MAELVCPCCGQNYAIGFEIAEGLRFFCEKCGRKHVFSAGKLVPCAIALPSPDGQRKARCPHCGGRILLFEGAEGEYPCPQCGEPFFVPPGEPESAPPPSGPVGWTPVAPPSPVAPPAPFAPPAPLTVRPFPPPDPAVRKPDKD